MLHKRTSNVGCRRAGRHYNYYASAITGPTRGVPTAAAAQGPLPAVVGATERPCDGVPDGGTSLDLCGVRRREQHATTAGVAASPNKFDACGVCDGGGRRAPAATACPTRGR